MKQAKAITGFSFLSKRGIIWTAIAFAILLYANSLRNGYNIDDELVTIKHRLTSKGISAIPEIFSSPYYQDEMGYSYEYRPVTLTVFAIEHQFFGDNPTASHFFNLALYVLLIVIFIKVAFQLFSEKNLFIVLITTLLFVAHPLHTEVVSSIKNRDELLALFFALLAFQQALLFLSSGKILRVMITPIFLLAGILSKTSCLSFFFIIPLAGVLIAEANLKRNLILFISLLPVLFFFLLLKGYPLVWALYLAIAIAMVLALVVLLRNDEWKRKTVDALKSFGLPEETALVKLSVSDIMIVDLLLYAFVAVFCIVAYLKSNFLLLLVPTAFLLFTFFWIKKVRFDLLILSALVVSFSMMFQENFYSLLFMFLFVYFASEKVQGHTLIKLLPAAILILTYLVKLFSGNDVIIGPILVVIVFLFLQKYIRWRYIKFVYIIYWSLIFVAQVVVVITTKKKPIDELYFFIFFIFSIILSAKFTGIKRLVSFVALILIAIIFFYCDLTDKYKDIFLGSPKIEISDNTGSTEKIISVSTDTEKVKSTSKNKNTLFATIQTEDRPLDFVEFPLGFNPTLSEKIGTVSFVLGYYIKMMFVPYPMCYYYGYNKINTEEISNVWSIISIIGHLLLGLSALYFFKKHPIYGFGVLAYLSSIFLFSNLVSPVAGMIGDRLTFVASFGFCIAIGYLLDKVYKNAPVNRVKLIIAGIIIVLVLYSGVTIARNIQWKSHMSLYKHDMKYLEESAQAHNLLAKRLLLESFNERSSENQLKMRQEGIGHFERAIEIYPEFFNPHVDLGKAYLLIGEFDAATKSYLKAYELDSTYTNALFLAAGIFVHVEKYEQAIKCFEKVIEKDKTNLQAHGSLSEVYFKQKNYEKSIAVNLKTMELFPSAYDPVVNIGKTYFTMGDKRNALIYFEKAYLINPRDRNLIVTIANIYKEFGENDKAEFYFSKLNQINR